MIKTIISGFSNKPNLRNGMWHDVDTEHLAEELEDMGKREKRALRSGTVVLLVHLLKYTYQPKHRSPSWIGTIREQRKHMRDLLGGEGFGRFWDLCRFAIEANQGAEPAVVGVGEAVFGSQRPIKPEL